MSDYLLADRAVEAFVSVLTEPLRTALGLGEGDPVPVCAEKTSAERADLPIVTVTAESGEEPVLYTGNFLVDVTVSVRCAAVEQTGDTVTAAAAAKTLVSAVANALITDDLETSLTSAVTEFHVFAGSARRLPGERLHDPDGTFTDDQFRFRLLACASDLA